MISILSLGRPKRHAKSAPAHPEAQPRSPRSPTERRATGARLRAPSRCALLLLISHPRDAHLPLEMATLPSRCASPAISSHRWGLDEWVMVIAFLVCCCGCLCGCVAKCCLRRRRARRRREAVQRPSPSATHRTHAHPDHDRARPPHHSHPRRLHPRPLHLPGAAAVPRSPGRRQRDQARAAAQCGRGGDLQGPRERRRLCGSRSVRPVVNRFYTRVGTPDSPAAAARRLPPPTAAGSCGGAAGRISGATLRARGVRRGVERGA